MDAFVKEGWVSFFRIALAILQSSEDYISTQPLDYLHSIPLDVLESDDLFRLATEFNVNMDVYNMMDELEKSCWKEEPKEAKPTVWDMATGWLRH